MKNNTYKYITPYLILMLVSCKTTVVTPVDKPEDIGKQLYSIVTKIPSSTQEEFLSHFLKLEELRTFVNNPEMKISQETKNKVTSWPKDEYYGDFIEKYDKIKERAASYEMDLSRITYDDFTYKINEVNGLKFCDGVLHFNYNEKDYKIESASIYTKNKYELFRIGRLTEN
ncbi:hypothetical protein FEZ18_05685 [Oceanihabitans sp. IOP_32]|uniref:hypothetical protein n=1 Tax=Oceanihabitans sp. IOP_32 TaxID=2529032 RepID=UPI001293BA9F|nr:hypothetical protein [Oceanihabitans sp. IOP_32]QFZ54313.1 hypothetical protein FEZ18_05685 [Oceanihabitans sp. IOP_32]